MSDQTQVRVKKPKSEKVNLEKRPCLIVVEGDYLGEIYPLEKATITIGRGEDSDIVFAESGISRCHAMLQKEHEGYTISDMRSTNGTEVNGETVEQSMLKDGDKITIGEVGLKFCYQDDIDNEYHMQLRNLAVKDGLTRIYNKRYFMDTLGKEFIYANRHQLPLSVVIFDIDHFKKFNDTYGHQAGDFVLKMVAGTIEKRIRGYDIFARYGGEEFIFLLRGLSQEVAIAFAERIRKVVDECRFSYEDQELHVTISVGVATMDAENAFQSDEELIAVADQFLYKAKAAGRNCVGNVKGE